jgi:hypothetical protein
VPVQPAAPSAEGAPAPEAPALAPPPTARAAAHDDMLVDLTIHATPPTARLFLDDVPLSANPSSGQYPRDEVVHRLRVEAPRYITQTTPVAFDGGTHLVEVTLQHVPPPPPPPPPPSARNPSSSP